MTKEEFRKIIIDNYLNEKDIVLVNIGTDKCIGDSFAPMLGTILHDNLKIIKTYGTLNDLINGLNLEKKVDYINKVHKNDFIIGIDSAIAEKELPCKQDFVILNTPLVPGEGVNVQLPKVGDICIHFCVKKENENLFDDLKKQTITEIYNRAKRAADFILEIDEELVKINNNRQEVK